VHNGTVSLRIGRQTADRPGTDRLKRVSSALAAPHPGLWAATLVIAGIDALWLAGSDVAVAPLGFSLVAATVTVLLAAAAFWGGVKPEPTLRAMALSTACLLAFTVAIALFHYLAATLARPLIDAELAAAEAALAFDWRDHVAFLNENPDLARGLALAYHSSGPQVALVVIMLSALRRVGRLWSFVRLFAVTLLVEGTSVMAPYVSIFVGTVLIAAAYTGTLPY
jgi:hypothetical protein